MAETEHYTGPEAVIAIGTPSGGTAYDEFVQQLWQMQILEGRKYCLIPLQSQGSAIAHNQNNIVKLARQASADLVARGQRGIDAIFFFENDESMLNLPDVIDRLWTSGKDIIGGTYCYKDAARVRVMGVEMDGKPIDWLSLYHREPVSQVLALPSGALFIRMGVFDALDKEEFTALSHEGVPMTITEAPIFQHDIHFGLKLVRTTDYVFCSRAATAGFSIWLDAQLSLEISHWGKYPYAVPHLSKINRQVATLQTIADDLAQSAEDEAGDPDVRAGHRAMAEDVFAVVADIVRRTGAFSFPARGEDRQPEEEAPV